MTKSRNPLLQALAFFGASIALNLFAFATGSIGLLRLFSLTALLGTLVVLGYYWFIAPPLERIGSSKIRVLAYLVYFLLLTCLQSFGIFLFGVF